MADCRAMAVLRSWWSLSKLFACHLLLWLDDFLVVVCFAVGVAFWGTLLLMFDCTAVVSVASTSTLLPFDIDGTSASLSEEWSGSIWSSFLPFLLESMDECVHTFSIWLCLWWKALTPQWPEDRIGCCRILLQYPGCILPQEWRLIGEPVCIDKWFLCGGRLFVLGRRLELALEYQSLQWRWRRVRMDVWVFVHNELTTIPLSITKIERTTNETRNKRDGNDDRCLDPCDGVCDIIMLLISIVLDIGDAFDCLMMLFWGGAGGDGFG